MDDDRLVGNYEDIILRMAAALLLKNGQVSINEIEALPFVEGEDHAKDVAIFLFNRFNLEFEEDYLLLKSPPLVPKTQRRGRVPNPSYRERAMNLEELLQIHQE